MAGEPQSGNRASFASRASASYMKAHEDNDSKASQARAWTNGTNPLTQKHSMQSTNEHSGSAGEPFSPATLTMTRRFQSVFYEAIGRNVEVILVDGRQYKGILTLFVGPKNLDGRVMLTNATQESGDGSAKNRPIHRLVLQEEDICVMEIPEIQKSGPGARGRANNAFRTDTDISRRSGNGQERQLQPWNAPSDALNHDTFDTRRSGPWDQFKANEEKFGVKTDYDEHFYTTAINRNDPQYAQKEKAAARLAAEIESQEATNAHVREERGLADQLNLGEEEKYSGVQRTEPVPSISVSASAEDATPAPKSELDAISPSVQPPVSTAEPKSDATAPKEPDSTVLKNISNGQPVPAAIQPDSTSSTGLQERVLNDFRHFKNVETVRVQESKRSRATADKAVKFNDLKSFAKHFQLNTPIPPDLVPILAKDVTKQQEIVDRAEKLAQANAESVANKAANSAASGPAQGAAQTTRKEGEAPLPAASQPSTKPRSKPESMVPSPIPQRNSPKPPANPTNVVYGGVGAKPQDTYRQHLPNVSNNNAGGFPPQERPPITLPQREKRSPAINNGYAAKGGMGQRGSNTGSQLKFNAHIAEFRPNPGASSFRPNPTASAGPNTPSLSVTSTVPIKTSRPFFREGRKLKFAAALPDGRKATPLTTTSIPSKPEPAAANDSQSKNADASSAPAGTQTAAENAVVFKPPYKTPPTYLPEPTEVYSGVETESKITSYVEFYVPGSAIYQQLNPNPVTPLLNYQMGAGAMYRQNMPMQNMPGGQFFNPQMQPQPGDDHMMRRVPSVAASYHPGSPRVPAAVAMAPSPSMHAPSMQYQQHGGFGSPHQSNFGRSVSGFQSPTNPGHFQGQQFMQPQGPGGYPPQPGYGGQMPMYNQQQHGGYGSPARGAMMMPSNSHQGQMYPHPGQFGSPMYYPNQTLPMNMMRPSYGQAPSYNGHQGPTQMGRTPSTHDFGYQQQQQQFSGQTSHAQSRATSNGYAPGTSEDGK